jgi:hypothetical protein
MLLWRPYAVLPGLSSSLVGTGTLGDATARVELNAAAEVLIDYARGYCRPGHMGRA